MTKKVPSRFSSVKKSQKRLCCGLGCKPTPEHGSVDYTTSLQDFFAPFSEASGPGQGETCVQRSLTAPLLLCPCTRAEESGVKQHCGPTKRPSTFTPPEAERGHLQHGHTRLCTKWREGSGAFSLSAHLKSPTTPGCKPVKISQTLRVQTENL